MKKSYLFTILSLAVLIFVNSCTSNKVASGKFIQKRKYTKGWFISSSENYKTTNASVIEENRNTLINNSSDSEEIETNVTDFSTKEPNIDQINRTANVEDASVYPSNLSITSETEEPISDYKTNSSDNSVEDCDIIFFKNGDEKLAKVVEVGTNEIKYKDCDNISGPTFTINKSKVLMIQYPNGSKTIIESSSDDDNNNNENKGKGKSQLIALLLCIFLGLFGIHRFYLGYTGMGILYLLTAGLCGIGALIDIILILTNSLKPKDGEYSEKL